MTIITLFYVRKSKSNKGGRLRNIKTIIPFLEKLIRATNKTLDFISGKNIDGDKKLQLGQFIFISPEVIFLGGREGYFQPMCALGREQQVCYGSADLINARRPKTEKNGVT